MRAISCQMRQPRVPFYFPAPDAHLLSSIPPSKRGGGGGGRGGDVRRRVIDCEERVPSILPIELIESSEGEICSWASPSHTGRITWGGEGRSAGICTWIATRVSPTLHHTCYVVSLFLLFKKAIWRDRGILYYGNVSLGNFFCMTDHYENIKSVLIIKKLLNTKGTRINPTVMDSFHLRSSVYGVIMEIKKGLTKYSWNHYSEARMFHVGYLH